MEQNKQTNKQNKQTKQSLYSTIITTIIKLKTHCFGIDCNVFHSSSCSWDYKHYHEHKNNIPLSLAK